MARKLAQWSNPARGNKQLRIHTFCVFLYLVIILPITLSFTYNHRCLRRL